MITSIIRMVDETKLEEMGVGEMSIRRNAIRRTGTNLDIHPWESVLTIGKISVLSMALTSLQINPSCFVQSWFNCF